MLDPSRRLAGANAGFWIFLAAICFFATWFSFLPADASVTSDDGAYALHVRALEETGAWSVPHRLAAVDPEGLTYPYQNAQVSDDGFFPAPRHAVWIRTLQGGDALGGLLGMRVVPALGLGVAAAAAVALYRLVHGPSGSWIAGALALASPLLFSSLQLWAHAAVTGGIAVAILGALHLTTQRASIGWLVVASIGASAAAMWRADGLIFAAATAAVVGFVGVRSRRTSLLVSGGIIGAAALAAFLLAGAYSQSIVGRSAQVGTTSSRASGSIEGRLRGALHTFFSATESPGGTVLLVVAFALTAYAVLQLRRGQSEEAVVLLGAAAAAWSVRFVAFPDDMASGLLGAWPISLLAFARPWGRFLPAERHILAIVGLAGLAVAVTQYDEGGGLNWGGRFLAPAIPAIAVLVAAAISDVWKRTDRRVPVALSALALSSVVASLVFDATFRSRHDSIIDQVAQSTVPVVTSATPLPRLAWNTYPDVDWLRVPQGDDEAESARVLLHLLEEQGISRIALYRVSDEAASVLSGVAGAMPDQLTVVDLASRQE